jgi:hypothetical protein
VLRPDGSVAIDEETAAETTTSHERLDLGPVGR